MRIFILSVWLIFYELVLIRWIGTEINVFAYLQNIPLVCCFLGFGLGLFIRDHDLNVKDFLVITLLIALLIIVPYSNDPLGQISLAVSSLGQSFVAWNFWHTIQFSTAYVPNIALGIILITLIMLLVTLNFLPLGVMIGRCYKGRESSVALYGWNLLGSLVGLWIFNVASILELEPTIWLGIVLMLVAQYYLFNREIPGRDVIALGLALIALIIGSNFLAHRGFTKVVWSPYQKLALKEAHAPPSNMEGGWILVNNSGYQIMLDLRPEALFRRPDLYTSELEGYTQYDLPFRFRPQAKSALLLGAGSGNDAAGAVRAKLDRITAVDIDPAIVEFGMTYHPEHPYSSPLVDTNITDARAFLSSTNDTYDVISFGLLDSHTTGQMTNARLDHFVYTRESLRTAARLLNPRGIMTLTFEASKPYIACRIKRLLQETFHHDPLVLRIPTTPYGFGGVMFVTGSEESVQQALADNARLRSLVASYGYELPDIETEVTTDDWPYIYLEKRSVPPLFGFVGIVVILMFVILRKTFIRQSLPRAVSFHDGYFFLSGMGFFLLEAVNISRAAVVLGSSWQPTAAIISGITLMALLANCIVLVRNVSPLKAGLLLIASCLFLVQFELTSLLALPQHLRFLFTGVTACLPLFFSGLLFSSVFAKTSEPQRALAMNLFGAICGAGLQCLSLVLGFQTLLWLVTAVYASALFCLTQRDGWRGASKLS